MIGMPTEPNVLVDTNYQGQPRKLLLHADRNGFFYVFDRTNGTLLLGQAVHPPRYMGQRDRERRQARASATRRA